MKINVSLGTTICVNPENREFLRLGIDVTEVDTDGDVEAQAATGLAAGIKVLKVIDEGLSEEVTDLLLGAAEPGLSKDLIEKHESAIAKLEELVGRQSALLGKTINKVKEHEEQLAND